MADKEFESKPQENTKTTGISDNPQRAVSEVEKNIDVNGIGVGSEGTGGDQTKAGLKMYTEEQMRDLLQREADKRITEAQKTWQKKIDALKTEIEMSKLSEEEKAKEISKQKEKELQEKEQEIMRREADFNTMKLLADEKLPTELLGVFESVPDMDKRIKAIRLYREIYNKAVADYKNEREKGSFHLLSGAKQFSKEEIAKMTPQQINEIFDKDPSLLLGAKER